jgi:hypothetical protein
MKRLAVSVLAVFSLVLLLACFFTQDSLAGRKIRGSGDLTTEERPVSGIKGVELATIGTLFIEVGDKEKLEIEAEDNLIEYFEANVRRGYLTIETNGRVSLQPRRPVNFFLTVKQLEEIEITSAGDIETPDLKAGDFEIMIGSSGNLDMGDLEVNSLNIRIGSSGDVSLGRVKAKDVEIDIGSSGDVRLVALEARLLIVDIGSSGNVRVGGGNVEEEDIQINSSGDFNGKSLECKEASVRVNSSGDAMVYVTKYLDARTHSSGDIYYAGDPEVERRATSSGVVRKSK